MTGISFSKFVKKVGSLLTIIIPIVAFTGCGEGDGQTPILGDPTSTAPGGGLLPPGFCDVINFEDACPAPLDSIVEFEGGPIVAPFDNPKVDANNDSAKVGRMQKFAADSGFTYGGSTMNLNTPFTVVAGSSFTMKVWSQRPVDVLFQTPLSGDIIVPHGGTGWEVLTFDFGTLAGSVAAITLIFDVDILGDAGNDPENWTFYFDDITLVPPGSSGVPIDPEVSLYDSAGNPDLVIPDDYSEVTGFGSESVINLLYADDDTYNPVLAVSSGTGYGANVAQIGFIGFEPGFVTFYETLDFKVKGMPNFVIFVKLYEDGARIRINLSSSGYAEALEDGWYQVSIPLSRFTGRTSATGIVFESDDTAPTQFTFFLTDIGFSGTVGGDSGDGGDGGDCGATDPVAVVFDDDYGDGVSFAPFGGSVNDVTVDTAEAYSGTAALKVVVPAADYTGGAMVVNPGRDVSAYDTLTFWAKASAARTLNVAGIGNDGADTTNATEVTNLALTTTWTKYTITIPNPAALTANTGLFHFAEGSDEGVYTIWFDEITYTSSSGGGDCGGGDGGNGGGDPDPVAVVFDDDYGDGVSFAPFGGSVNDVTVDTAEAYSGTAALKVEVPSAEYTGGAMVVNPGRDVSGYDTLTFWAKASAARTLNVAGIGNDGVDTTNATEVTNLALTTTWTKYTITIPNPSALTANTGLFHFAEGSDEGVYTIWFDDIIYEVSGSGGGGGNGGGAEGNLAVNGAFDTGDFTGWAQYPSAQTTQTIVVDGTTSSNVARLFIPASAGGVNNVLKQERLLDGEGVFSAGDVIQISFDYRGEPGEGILFVKSICETAEPICGDKLHNNGGPFVPAGWTNYTDTFTLGAGVTGYTLEFAAVCGGTGTCVADYFIDNVSITIQ